MGSLRCYGEWKDIHSTEKQFAELCAWKVGKVYAANIAIINFMARHIMKKKAFSEHNWPTLCWPETGFFLFLGSLLWESWLQQLVAWGLVVLASVAAWFFLVSWQFVVLSLVAAACCLGFGCVGLLQISFLGIVLCFPRVAAACCLGFGYVGVLHLLFLGIVLCFPSVQTLVFSCVGLRLVFTWLQPGFGVCSLLLGVWLCWPLAALVSWHCVVLSLVAAACCLGFGCDSDLATLVSWHCVVLGLWFHVDAWPLF
ncbi:uncharacterized protein A4U43_C07F31240 [Asparagus officinalis]|uniref:Uncharacterized protein n=1 Tax=Asparagus officinalis TaxID=4686 RepID=A0A5P1EG69_ASPOF|nr:uncharacterized protein A4U43_C07F31240 [Asparagus officinalis]